VLCVLCCRGSQGVCPKPLPAAREPASLHPSHTGHGSTGATSAHPTAAAGGAADLFSVGAGRGGAGPGGVVAQAGSQNLRCSSPAPPHRCSCNRGDLLGVQVHCSWSPAVVCPPHLCVLPSVSVPQQHCMTDSTAAAGARTDPNPRFGGMPPSAQVCQELNGLLRRELRLASGELRRAVTAELATAGSAGEGDYIMTRDRSSSAAATTG
jgi:hypothetical protein